MNKKNTMQKHLLAGLDLALRMIATGEEYGASEENMLAVISYAMLLEDEICDPVTVDFLKLIIQEDIRYGRPVLPDFDNSDQLHEALRFIRDRHE